MVAFILTSALTPLGAWPVYVLLLALVLSAELLSDLGIAFYLKRALLALPFVLAALPVLFTTRGESLLSLPLGLTVTPEGLKRFLSISLKSWISIQAAILLASTTLFPDILMAMRALRLPRLLVAIIGLMWRYLFVIVDEVLRLLRARTSRSGETRPPGHRSGGALLWRARVTGGMAGSLLLALHRALRPHLQRHALARLRRRSAQPAPSRPCDLWIGSFWLALPRPTASCSPWADWSGDNPHVLCR